MKQIFMRLVSAGIASFCLVSAFGQEKMTVERIAREKTLVKEAVKLRAGEGQQPDSVVMYDDTGNSICTYTSGQVEYNLAFFPHLIKYDGYWYISIDHFSDYAMPPVFVMENENVKYHSNGKVESINYQMIAPAQTCDIFNQFQYNANGLLLSVDYYLRCGNSTELELWLKDTYFYDVHENWVGFQRRGVQSEDTHFEATYNARVDSQGRIVYSERKTGSGYISDAQFYYYIWYYSNGRTPNVEVANNTSIGSENQGSFEMNVNIPTDSIDNGSITVTLPDGFILDEKNTTLTLDFANLFELTITKQKNNSWLLEIKPKTLRSVPLRANEAKTMFQVAYLVDEKVKRGTYDISVNSILFETKGGNYIPEPVITIPVAVERWGVGNEPIITLTPTVYTSNQTIYIQSANSERITIYSIIGQKLYETAIQSGLNTINSSQFPQGILFIKGNSGWIKKLITK